MSDISQALAPLPQQFTLAYSVVAAVAYPTVVQLCGANPLRWALLVTPPLDTGTGLPINSFAAPNSLFLRNNAGIVLSQAYPTLSMDFRSYGILAQQAWFGTSINAAVGQNWGITEVIIQQ